jgi:hypothetical protein
MSPEEIIARLPETQGNTQGLLDKLLEAFWQGFPVTNLEPLLRHPNVSVVRDAGWILSELGTKGAELIGISVELLSHPLEELRSDAMGNLLANSARCEPEAAWAVVSRYLDETQRIKEQIVDYLARVPLTLLRDAVAYRTDADAASHEAGFRLHLAPAVGQPILDALGSPDPVIRAYALAATKRLEIFVDSAWRLAARSDDPVLRSRAKLWLPK